MNAPSLQPGETLAERYTVERELGRGGMATVFLAHDVKHDRKVAVKLLRPELGAVLGAERFLREITVTANLHHPHILQLYDSGEAGGLLYYVMPFVDGESLRDKLERERQLSVDESVALTTAIADALDYAHRHGVVHRDIKPENVLLRDGHPVVADFGIALAVSAAGGARLTETGMSLGTPHYMSPEQALGDREIDARSDVYALGCLLYEMLAGDPPFQGTNVQAVTARILTEKPSRLRTARHQVTAELETTVLKALEKTPADRFKSAGEFGAALAGGGVKAGVSRKKLVTASVGIVVAVTTIVATVLNMNTSAGNESVPSFTEHEPITVSGSAYDPALSPDGDFLAYVASRATLVVHDLATGSSIDLHTEEGISLLGWIPDGQELVFHVAGAGRGLRTLPRLGGTPRTFRAGGVADYRPDIGMLIEGDLDALEARSLEGGDAAGRRIEVSGFRRVLSLAASPSGNRIAFAGQKEDGRFAIETISRDGGHQVLAYGPAEEIHRLRWAAGGDRIYFTERGEAGNRLMAVNVHPVSGIPSGDAVPVITGIEMGPSFDVGVEQDVVGYTRERITAHLWSITIDPNGVEAPDLSQLTDGTARYSAPTVSPDGESIAFVRGQRGRSDIYVMSLNDGAVRQVTRQRALIGQPAWSPDGRQLAYGSDATGEPAPMLVSAQGGTPRRVGTRPISTESFNIAWSSDGSRVLYHDPDHANFTWVDLAAGDESPLLAESPPPWVFGPVPSPDGEWIAMDWNMGRDSSGLWIVRPDGTDARFVGDFEGGASGWVGDTIVMWDHEHDGVDRLYKVRASGGEPIPYLDLGFSCEWLTLSADATMVVCARQSIVSDVWIARREPGAGTGEP